MGNIAEYKQCEKNIIRQTNFYHEMHTLFICGVGRLQLAFEEVDLELETQCLSEAWVRIILSKAYSHCPRKIHGSCSDCVNATWS